ncbi:MAG: VOC family protein [Thermoleophilaceae bacterium]|nr:VOC family protein [Thermoleophilaceae bacterium]
MPASLDHVGMEVSDFERSRSFYEAVLAPLELRVLMEPVPGVMGFGSDFPFFWISERGRDAVKGAHVAFRVRSREAVDAFHAAALAAGGTDNGEPGLREIYHPGYYGAFVLDPDGNNIEAVNHTF